MHALLTKHISKVNWQIEPTRKYQSIDNHKHFNVWLYHIQLK